MSMYPIASYTTTASGGDATITLSSIPATFTHLQLRVFACDTTSGTGMTGGYMRFNGDSGGNYARHYVEGDGASATSGASSPSQFSAGQFLVMPKAGDTANAWATWVIDILDYANTNKNKTMKGIAGVDLNGSGQVYFGSSLWMSTAAINSILLGASTNFAQGTRVDLYGISTSNATGA